MFNDGIEKALKEEEEKKIEQKKATGKNDTRNYCY